MNCLRQQSYLVSPKYKQEYLNNCCRQCNEIYCSLHPSQVKSRTYAEDTFQLAKETLVELQKIGKQLDDIRLKNMN